MEGRLFLISVWCGVYSQALRHVFRRAHLQNVWMTVLFNSLFWATVGVILGMLRASYLTGGEFQFKYSMSFALLGLLLGSTLGYFRGQDREKRDRLLRDNLEWADTGFSAILLASVVMFFVVQAFKIPSGSMRMTFVEGDHLFVNKFIYGVPIPFSKQKLFPFKKVKKSDIVIFRYPSKDKSNIHYGKDFIKRVVALEGQAVEIRNKVLYIDGTPQEEPYKQHKDPDIIHPPHKIDDFQTNWEQGGFEGYNGNFIRDNFGPVVIPPGHVMVLGDNRDGSFDSRFWGPLDLASIKGKAWVLYWPFSRFKLVH